MKKYLAFVLISGLVIGTASVSSDHVRPCHLVYCSTYDTLRILLSGVLNDFISWLAMSILLGYLFGNSWNQSVFAGAGFVIFAMSVYFVIPEVSNMNSTGPALNLVDRFSWLSEWLLFSFVGGTVGGFVGFAFRRHPVSMLVFVVFIIVRIGHYGVSSWQNSIGILQNATFLLLAIAAVFWMVIRMCSGIFRNCLPES
jgi:hypothetical protein